MAKTPHTISKTKSYKIDIFQIFSIIIVLVAIFFVDIDQISTLRSEFRFNNSDSNSFIFLVALFFVVAFIDKNFRTLKLFFSISVFLIVSSLTYSYPVEFPRFVGGLSLIFVFLGSLSFFLLIISTSKMVAICLGAYCIFALFYHDLKHEKYAFQSEANAEKSQGINSTFAEWLKTRPDKIQYQKKGMPYPVFLVSSGGGGGYAAAHSYLSLAALSGRCPSFSDHIFSLVGVSGGAVGNGLYFSNLEYLHRHSEAGAVCGDKSELNINPVIQDHLSPLVGTLLFLEIPQRLLFLNPGRTSRSNILGDSLQSGGANWNGISDVGLWESSWIDQKDKRKKTKSSMNPLQVPLATNVTTGEQFAFAPFNRTHMYGSFTKRGQTLPAIFDGEEVAADIKLVDAIVTSASFPWFTPSINFIFNPESYKKFGKNEFNSALLVDGGYFENTGASLHVEIYQKLKEENSMELPQEGDCEHNSPESVDLYFLAPESYDDVGYLWKCGIPFTIMNITHNTQDDYVLTDEQSFSLDPLKTFFNTRNAKGRNSYADLNISVCGLWSCMGPGDMTPEIWGMLNSKIQPSKFKLPLGWKMPKNGIKKLESELNPSDADCAKSGSSRCRLIDAVKIMMN